MNFSCLGPVSLIPRKKTPLVMGTGTPLITKVASATVNGLNGFEIGTLMLPAGPLNPTLVPGILNGSGRNGTAAEDASKNERTYLKSTNTVQVFVTRIAHEGTVEALAVSRRKRGRYGRKVIEEVVATLLIISAELWNVLGCIWPDDTGRTWICIGSNSKGVL